MSKLSILNKVTADVPVPVAEEWVHLKAFVKKNFNQIFKDSTPVEGMTYEAWRAKYDFRRQNLID